MDDIKISVIVPVYNSEKTLVRCADSILNGTHKNIELIFINDESTDNSLEICLRYADRDGRVKVINKENRGVSIARNEGVAAATGDYIAFVDSDDYVDRDMYEKLLNNSDCASADIVFCGYNTVNGDKIIPRVEPQFALTVTDKRYRSNFQYDTENYVMGNVWRMIVKSEIAKSVTFRNDIHIAEDLVYLLSVLNIAKKVNTVNERLYFYSYSSNVATHYKYMKEEYVDSYKELSEFLSAYYSVLGDDETAKYCRFSNFINIWRCYIYSAFGIRRIRKELKKYRKTGMAAFSTMRAYVRNVKSSRQKILAILIYFKMYAVARKLALFRNKSKS